MRRSSLLWHRKEIALRKFIAVALSISFIVSPTAIAFAQEAGIDTTPTDTAPIGTSPDTPSAPTASAPPPALSIPGVDGLPDGSVSDNSGSIDQTSSSLDATTDG